MYVSRDILSAPYSFPAPEFSCCCDFSVDILPTGTSWQSLETGTQLRHVDDVKK